MSASFVISLDFELYWGVCDQLPLSQYRDTLLRTRSAIPALLDIFAAREIHATWATVGALFCESKDELQGLIPPQEHDLADPLLCFRHYATDVGESEDDDPFHFAPSLIRRIADTPHQEIASHTFGHYYCLEQGASESGLRKDLTAAKTVAAAKGYELSSLVFPRNQYDNSALRVAKSLGFTSYRGNPESWFYTPSRFSSEGILRRGVRLADAFVDVQGRTDEESSEGGELPRNVKATALLRPHSPRLKRLDKLKLRRIKRGMLEAARSGRTYHLWWHPHNFGNHEASNFAALTNLLDYYKVLEGEYGMASRSMSEMVKN